MSLINARRDGIKGLGSTALPPTALPGTDDWSPFSWNPHCDPGVQSDYGNYEDFGISKNTT